MEYAPRDLGMFGCKTLIWAPEVGFNIVIFTNVVRLSCS